VIVLSVLVVVLAIALLIVKLTASDGDESATAVAVATTALASTAFAADQPLATSTTKVTPPAGWVSYTDPAGWSIAYPAGWTRNAGVGGPGTVDVSDPATGTVLRVGSEGLAPASVLRDWLTNFETASHSGAMGLAGYHRLRLGPVDHGDGSTEAEWEYTFSKNGGTVHVVLRGADRGGHGYLLSWQTKEELWAGDQALRRRLFAAFRPAP
jgi:hypothetical protein